MGATIRTGPANRGEDFAVERLFLAGVTQLSD
jgi:hypothetical protein